MNTGKGNGCRTHTRALAPCLLRLACGHARVGKVAVLCAEELDGTNETGEMPADGIPIGVQEDGATAPHATDVVANNGEMSGDIYIYGR